MFIKELLNLKTRNKRQKAYFRGIFAEILGALFLFFKGYRLLKWRYKSPYGEIDLIFQKRKQLIAVEVKWRRNYADAVQSITRNQLQRLKNALVFFQGYDFADYDLRIDALIWSGWLWPHHIINIDIE